MHVYWSVKDIFGNYCHFVECFKSARQSARKQTRENSSALKHMQAPTCKRFSEWYEHPECDSDISYRPLECHSCIQRLMDSTSLEWNVFVRKATWQSISIANALALVPFHSNQMTRTHESHRDEDSEIVVVSSTTKYIIYFSINIFSVPSSTVIWHVSTLPDISVTCAICQIFLIEKINQFPFSI